ncbi:hypothetical protein OXPF_07590 [Oxobacter pfennigii]|uniref:Uracil DNA glycosylase superfamily protein n=1 Tax=Oxobacter pfennigii TaxID=36849 RepID=A0A0P8X3Z5_9CLOT|nr:uracil-DNA glycosylase family protein [Oxobacter pfennigii]KPU45526.1 hypothetical protein OXPF_07590 [Oxobacter pfennigii]
MIVNHINYPDENLKIYCRLINKVLTFNQTYADEKCSSCPFFYGTSQGRGVECFWEEKDELMEKEMIVKDPYEEYIRVYKAIDEKNKTYNKDRKKFIRKNKIPKEIMALREQIKGCRMCTESKDNRKEGLVNPFDIFAEEEYLQPYTTNYWTDWCFNSPADIAVIGQDLGTISIIRDYEKRGRCPQENEMRCNLEEGIKHINCTDKTILLNSVMCIKEGSACKIDNHDNNYISKCKNIVMRHLELVKPKIVITLGKGVTQKYLNNIKRSDTFYNLVSQPYWIAEKQWFIFPMYILGVKGKLGRQHIRSINKEISEDFLTDFNLVKRLLISYYAGMFIHNIKYDVLMPDSLEEYLLNPFPEHSNEVKTICNLITNGTFGQSLNELKSFEKTVIYIYNHLIQSFESIKEGSNALTL